MKMSPELKIDDPDHHKRHDLHIHWTLGRPIGCLGLVRAELPKEASLLASPEARWNLSASMMKSLHLGCVSNSASPSTFCDEHHCSVKSPDETKFKALQAFQQEGNAMASYRPAATGQ